MGNNVDSVLNEILKDYKAIALEAVKDAAHKGQEDVMKEAKNYLDEYYRNYSPKMYKRTGRLRRAILPYWSDKSNSNSVSITIGVQYNASALKGAYRSSSRYHQTGDVWKIVPDSVKKDKYVFSSDYGMPEPNWILENYLQGIHPWAQTDAQGTEEKMNKFLDDELPARIEKYMQTALFSAIASRL